MRRGLLTFALVLGAGGFTAVLPASLSAQVDDALARGRARLELGDWNGALLVLRAALPEGDENPDLHSALARAYSELGEDVPEGSAPQKANFQKALEHAERELRLAPRSAQAHLDVSIAVGKLARVSGAKTKLKLARRVRDEAVRAIELDPKLWQAYHVLGVWNREIATLGGFKKLGASLLGGVPKASLKDAIANLETARQLAPNSIRNHLELGRTYLEANREEEARAELGRAIELPSTEPRDRALQRDARNELAELSS
jgi:Flp pilus assembly protein TadD